MMHKNILGFILPVLLMLGFSMVQAADETGGRNGNTSSDTGSAGMSMSSTLSSIRPSAAIQVDTPSANFFEPPVMDGRGDKSQGLETNAPDTGNRDHPNGKYNGKDELPTKSEFQDFVAQSIGHLLPVYGYSLFHRAPSTFAPVDNVPVPSDYIIGPGDELLVRLWGQVEANQRVIVDRNGLINLPRVGPISVVGVRYQNLQSHLKSSISKMFRNFELDVSLGKLRSIQVFVVGQAAHPGNYTVSSLSTLVNTLFASGGPSATGSMRHIQLKRDDKVITEFDLYDLLLKGDKSKDAQLLPGDVIYIPPVRAMAAVAGSVNTPAIFELKGEETLADLLELASGLTNLAAGQEVSVERIAERQVRKVDTFLLDKDGLAKPMRDGDLVTVHSISGRFDNAVTLRGNVAGLHAGRHPWSAGLRVSDVIPDKNALIVDDYWDNQNLYGRLHFRGDPKYGDSKLGDPRYGAPKLGDPRYADLPKYSDSKLGDPNYDDLKSRTEIKHANVEVNWDYAVIERFNTKDLTTNLIPFNLGKAIIDHDPVQNMLLQPGDVITIFSKDDIQVPIAKRTKYVVLEGELTHPGVYQAQPGETLRQLVMRVEGVSPQAYLFGSEFTRESTRQIQQKRLDEILDRMEAEVQRNAAKASSGALSKDDVDAAKSQAESQQALLAKMRQVKATGRIVMEMPEQDPQVKDLPDIELEDGDRLYVPAPASTVSVMGTVYNQNVFLYKKGQTINDYLDKAGGPTRDGDADDIYMVRADGLVFSKRQGSAIFGGFGGRQAMPGDTIVVPEKIDKYNLTKDFKDWTQIFYQFAIGIASLKTIGVF